MKTRLVRIGNSRGVRIPKPLLEESGLPEEVDLRVRKGSIVILPAARPRAGWAEAAELLRQRNEDLLLDEPTPTEFDEKEWRW
jgi:antitoxin MazE